MVLSETRLECIDIGRGGLVRVEYYHRQNLTLLAVLLTRNHTLFPVDGLNLYYPILYQTPNKFQYRAKLRFLMWGI